MKRIIDIAVTLWMSLSVLLLVVSLATLQGALS